MPKNLFWNQARQSTSKPIDYIGAHIKTDYNFKVVFVGNAGSGKTSLLTRFADKRYQDGYRSTIGVDFKLRTVRICEKNVKLQCWDTSGNERFRAITNTYYQRAHVLAIVYDITDEKSFLKIPNWLKEIENCGSFGRNRRPVIVIVGNKTDLNLQRTVSRERAERFACNAGLQYIETSARSGENVDALFNDMAKLSIATRSISAPRIEIDISRAKRINWDEQDRCLPSFKSCALAVSLIWRKGVCSTVTPCAS